MKKSKCIILGLSIALLGIILTYTYRPYIYENKIYDFHFADVIGNLVAVPAALFFLSGIQKSKTKIVYSIPTVVLTFILYEFIGISETFDVLDIYVTIINGIVLFLILYYVFQIKEL